MNLENLSNSLIAEIGRIFDTINLIRLSHTKRSKLNSQLQGDSNFNVTSLLEELDLKNDFDKDSPIYTALESMIIDHFNERLNSLIFLNKLITKAINEAIIESHLQFFYEKERDENLYSLEQEFLKKYSEDESSERIQEYFKLLKTNEQKTQLITMLATMHSMQEQYSFLNIEIKKIDEEIKKTINDVTKNISGPEGEPLSEPIQDKIDTQFQNDLKVTYQEFRKEKLDQIGKGNNRVAPHGVMFREHEKSIEKLISDDVKFKLQAEKRYIEVSKNVLLSHNIYKSTQIELLEQNVKNAFNKNPACLYEMTKKIEKRIVVEEKKEIFIEEYKKMANDIKQKLKENLNVDLGRIEDLFSDKLLDEVIVVGAVNRPKF